MKPLSHYLPSWLEDWLDIVVPAIHILLIIAVATTAYRLLRYLVRRAVAHYRWPPETMVPILGVLRWLIIAGTVLLILERLGMSAAVLWSAFTGFAAVGAVAFFAAWSVLSNLFCALLIFTVGPFRLGDTIEVLDTAEKPGAKGKVVDINLLYTTLEEHGSGGPDHPPVLMQIPNMLVFQRVVRRWQGEAPLVPKASGPAPSPSPVPAIPALETPKT